MTWTLGPDSWRESVQCQASASGKIADPWSLHQEPTPALPAGNASVQGCCGSPPNNADPRRKSLIASMTAQTSSQQNTHVFAESGSPCRLSSAHRKHQLQHHQTLDETMSPLSRTDPASRDSSGKAGRGCPPSHESDPSYTPKRTSSSLETRNPCTPKITPIQATAEVELLTVWC